MSESAPLEIFVDCLTNVPDPRSKYGKSHPFPAILAVVFPGLPANLSTLAEIQRRAEIHFSQLKQFLEFKDKNGRRKTPHAITFARVLRKLSPDDLQTAFAGFINAIHSSSLFAAAVDGKAARQMTDDGGAPILMLDIFAQTLKIHLASWSVRGDKTDEPGCLKQHPGELFAMVPCLKLPTGDAVCAQRPLSEAIREYHRDCPVQIEDNQGKTLEQMKRTFEDARQQPPSDVQVDKKREPLRVVACG